MDMGFDSVVDSGITSGNDRVTDQVTRLRDVPRSAMENIPFESVVVLDGFNSRKTITDEELMELGESIEAQGLQTPIALVKLPKGEREKYPGKDYALLAGERRFRSLDGYTSFDSIPLVIVYDESGWEFKISIMLTENSNRENPTIFEQLEGVKRALKFEYSDYSDPGAEFIKAGIMSKTHIARACVALCRAIEADPDIEEALQAANISDYRALHGISDLVMLSEGGSLDKRKKDHLIKFFETLKKGNLAVKNMSQTIKDLKNWGKGKSQKRPEIKTVSGTKESGIDSEQKGQSTESKPRTKKYLKETDFNILINKLISLQNGDIELHPEFNKDAAEKLSKLLSQLAETVGV